MSAVSSGAGRLIIAIYAIFALAASARALYQLYKKFEEAPLAYSLSAVAAVVYIIATIALVRNNAKLATMTIGFELAGVLIIGTLSLLDPTDFQHQTVWSVYGMGYGFVPLILPLWGLYWIWKSKRA
ncbi:MAG: hypothetical protein RLZ53_506 [Actinomycetota bacterium]